MIFILVLISAAQRETVMRAARNHPALRAIIQTLSGRRRLHWAGRKRGLTRDAVSESSGNGTGYQFGGFVMMVSKASGSIDLTQFHLRVEMYADPGGHGAEVVKVEPPQGDALRLIFKPDTRSGEELLGVQPEQIRHGRRLRGPEQGAHPSPSGQGRHLCPQPSFGHPRAVGLGYDELRKDRPDLIYLAVSGSGATA